VQALYLPAAVRKLACRHCHDLTYRSAQRHDKRVDLLRRQPARLEQLLRSPGLPLRVWRPA
jgi:hypothetical protein